MLLKNFLVIIDQIGIPRFMLIMVVVDGSTILQ